ncbi:MAG: hypothetical protein RIB84_09565 [Sneathiellaceae bacterium]
MTVPSDRRPPAPAARRRLVLRVSTRHDVEAGLQTTIALASALRGELSALFVEEEASLHAVALPFQTLMDFTGGLVTLAPGRIETAMRGEARACRRLLAAAAEQARLQWSFRSLRGDALHLLHQEGIAGDILVLNLDRFGLSGGEALARAGQLAPPGGGVLLLPPKVSRKAQPPAAQPVLTLGQDATPAAPLRGLAEHLAQALGSPLGHCTIAGPASVPALAGELARARLLLMRLESPLFDAPDSLRQIGFALRAPLLAIRTDQAG